MQNAKFLEKESISKLFFKYAIPSVITFTFFGLQSIIDGVIVRSFIGIYAMGAVNIVVPFFSILAVISIVIGIGCQTIFSISIGAKNIKRAKDVMATGFLSLVGIGFLLTILLFSFTNDFVILLGANKLLLPYVKEYLTGLIPFIIFISMSIYFDLMLKAMGYPYWSMIIMSLAIILNIFMSIIFVVIFKMGIIGVSLATGISLTLACIASGIIILNPKQTISILKGSFSFQLFKKAIYNGASEGVSELSSAITIFAMNLVIIKIAGADGIVAFTMINYINLLGILIFIGISDGLIPVLSHNYGAKNFKRVKQIFKFTALMNIILGLFIFVFLQFFGKYLISLFFDNNKYIMNIAVKGLQIYSFMFLISGLNIVITSFFTSVEQAKESIIISVFRVGIFIVIGILILPLFFQLNGVWLAVPIAEVLTLFVSLFLFIFFKNKYLNR